MSIVLSLCKISDAIQLPVTYEDGKISGGGVVRFPAVDDLPEFLFPVESRKVFVKEQVGVLFSIRGDLSLILSHYPKMGSVAAFFIDGQRLKMDGVKAPPELFISKTMNLQEVLASLGKAVVASFYYAGGGWKRLKMPD